MRASAISMADVPTDPTAVERITIGLHQKAQADLKALIAATGLSKTDLCNQGLMLLAFVKESEADGYEFLRRPKRRADEEPADVEIIRFV